MNYYNEFDQFAAAWLRELIAAELIPDGDVDTRDIREVKGSDLDGYDQCHFFAGIGGWPLALRLAGWPDDRPVWTGSCPCQPYSSAGKQRGNADERDLWPAWFPLIRERKPEYVFGEQVSDAIRHGWLDRIHDDMEREAYAIGAIVLPACSVETELVEVSEGWRTEGETEVNWESHYRTAGPPHIRHRLWWGGRLAFSDKRGWTFGRESGTGAYRELGKRNSSAEYVSQTANTMPVGGLEHAASDRREQGRAEPGGRGTSGGCGNGRGNNGMGHTSGTRPQGWPRVPSGSNQQPAGQAGMVDWLQFQFTQCRDGKYRRTPVESLLFPLADGIPNRVGMLRGAGNAIVPGLAAEFVRVFMDWLSPEDLDI